MRDNGSGELLEDEGWKAVSEGEKEGDLVVSYDAMELEARFERFEGGRNKRKKEGSSKR